LVGSTERGPTGVIDRESATTGNRVYYFHPSMATAQNKIENGPGDSQSTKTGRPETVNETGGESINRIRYAVIGDSYSIGEGASLNESWPAVLTQHLNAEGLRVDLVANPSRTGWTTQRAIDHELPVFVAAKPDFATLQIGVNDWVQGVDQETFRQRFIFLLDQMLAVLRDNNRLLIVTLPDFGVTPIGRRYSRGRDISEGLTRFNEIIAKESKKRGLRVVDVFEFSKKMGNDRSLVGADGLHPSAREYAEWEKIIFPVAVELLRGVTHSRD
jgi:lysophospholipase L1-like esterase